MRSRILVIDGSCDLRYLLEAEGPRYRAIVCLFWASRKTKCRISESLGATCYSLSDIIGDIGSVEKELAEFTWRICDQGPRYRGLPLRRYLSEELFRSAVYPKVFLKLRDFLEWVRKEFKAGYLEVDLLLSEKQWEQLKGLDSIDRSGIFFNFKAHEKTEALLLHNPSYMSFAQRLVRQLKAAKKTGQWGALVWNVIEKLDRDYGKRYFWSHLKKPGSFPIEPITFFSSYLNNTLTLRAFEPYMPHPVHWVVSNYYARRPVSDKGKNVNWIWDFGTSGASHTYFRAPRIEDDFDEQVPEDGVLKACIRGSRILSGWNNGHLTSLVNLTDCWDKYLEKARPKLVVMANQWGIEGWFTEIARQRGIPVLQILHGVLGGHFYTGAPIISDAMVVHGEFWRNLWPEKERVKIHVFNPPGLINRVKKSHSGDKRVLTYFSWPLHKSPFFNFSELTDGFIDMFHKLLEQERCEICVRFHPLENPSDFIGRWKYLCGSFPKGLRFSKHEPLDEVLAGTDVALMFRSTVMLNCFVNSIPVVLPGWMDFGLNQPLIEQKGVALASDYDELEFRINEWLEKPSQFHDQAAECFVEKPGKGEQDFRSFLEKLTGVSSRLG